MARLTHASGTASAGSGPLDAPFDGYPYLVTRIGHSAIRHLAVLPAHLERDELVQRARKQAATNGFDTCVVLGPADVIYATPGGTEAATDYIPTGLVGCDRLVIGGAYPETDELVARREALRRYVDAHRQGGYVVGDNLEGGAPATPADIERLGGTGPGGLPAGLALCPACGLPRGDALRPLPGDGSLPPLPVGRRRYRHDDAVAREVVRVRCRCENANRCAGCGEPLAERALSSWGWDEGERKLMYWAAYIGLDHRCRAPHGRIALVVGSPRAS